MSLLVSEYGITGYLDAESRRFELKSPFWPETFPSFKDFLHAYKLQPLCVLPTVEQHAHIRLIPLEILADGRIGELLDEYIAVGEFPQKFSRFPIDMSTHAERVYFWIRAMQYHLYRLTKGYVESLTHFYNSAVRRFSFQPSQCAIPAFGHVAEIWSARHAGEDLGITGSGDDGLFYEIVAFLTSGRILLNRLLPILRSRRTVHIPEKGQRSFRRFMERIDKCTLPPELDTELCNAWEGWLKRFIDFRNWVIHSETYGPHPGLDPYFSLVLHSRDAVIGFFLRLPDNPPPNPYNPKWQYQYRQRLDGLAYVAGVYCQLLKLCLFILADTLREFEEGDLKVSPHGIHPTATRERD